MPISWGLMLPSRPTCAAHWEVLSVWEPKEMKESQKRRQETQGRRLWSCSWKTKMCPHHLPCFPSPWVPCLLWNLHCLLCSGLLECGSQQKWRKEGKLIVSLLVNVKFYKITLCHRVWLVLASSHEVRYQEYYEKKYVPSQVDNTSHTWGHQTDHCHCLQAHHSSAYIQRWFGIRGHGRWCMSYRYTSYMEPWLPAWWIVRSPPMKELP